MQRSFIKTFIGPVLLWAVSASSAFGQLKVAFFNDGASAVTNALTGQRAEAGLFQAALYYVPWDPAGTNPPASTLSQIGDPVTLDPAGYYIGPNITLPLLGPALQRAWFQVRVWESAYGSTFEEAIAAPPMNGRSALRGTSIIRSLDAYAGATSLTQPPWLLSEVFAGITLGLAEAPELHIARSGANVVISWTGTNTNLKLQAASTLPGGAGWNIVSNAVTVMGDQRSVTVNASDPARFYRLFQP